MSELLRRLEQILSGGDTQLPAEVIDQLGEFLQGQSMGGMQDEQADMTGLDRMGMMQSGTRPNPMINSLQLDR